MKKYTFQVKTHLIGITTITVELPGSGVRDGDYNKAQKEAKRKIGEIDMVGDRWELWHHPHRTESEVELEPTKIEELPDDEEDVEEAE